MKRESTERRKDKTVERIGKKESNLSYVAEDETESDEGLLSDTENEAPPSSVSSYASRSTSLPRNYGRAGGPERVSMMSAMMRSSAANNNGTMARPSNLPLRNKNNWKAKVIIFYLQLYLITSIIFPQYFYKIIQF